jgi:hypothetical protein
MRVGIATAFLLACSATEMLDASAPSDDASDAEVADGSSMESSLLDASMDSSDAADEDVLLDTGTCEHTPTAETCFDDLDNDCDGLVDCADPDCTPTAECVPNASGSFNLGTIVPQNTSCPSGFNGFKPDLYNQVDPGTDCSGCSCTPTMSCSMTVGDYGSNACPNGQLQKTVSATKFCNDNGGNGIGFSSGKISMAPPVTNAQCLGAGNPQLPALGWAGQVTFCTTASVGGCGPNQRCVPRLQNGKHCAFAFGTMSCPSGYQAEGSGPWYGSFTDQRSCSVCSCSSQPQGADCSMVKAAFSTQLGCMGNLKTEAGNSSDCSAGGPFQSVVLANPPPMPTCSNSGASSKVMGSVNVQGWDRTLCCE